MQGELRELKLDNGFRALLVERHSLPVVATFLSYDVGSRDELTGETGLSHFLEHMMFKGTAKYAKGEIDQITSKLGGANNAFTDHDCTGYYFSLASDRWETALEIEADRMQNCSFDPAEFEAERSVVLEELAMGKDEPWKVLWEAAEALTFDVHPYRRPVIGYRQDLEKVDAAGMRAYYERHYAPNRATLVVVGDIDAKRSRKRISELFGGIPRGAERAPVLDEPVDHSERRAVIRAPGELTRIAFACKTCRMGERDDFVLDLLSQVLGGGRSSRLYRRLIIDSELATHVSTYNETRLDPGVFWTIVELRPEADPGKVEAVLREEFDKLLQEGITAAELKRARIQVRSGFMFEDETCLDTAQKIGRFATQARGGVDLLPQILPMLDSVQRREIREVANRYFAAQRWSVVWSLPQEAELRRPGANGVLRRKAAKKKRAAKKKTAKKKAAKKAGATEGKRRIVKRVAKQPVTKPVTKSATKPAPKPAAKPVTKLATKPAAAPAAKPATKPSAKPAAKPLAKPVAKPAAKPTDAKPSGDSK